MTPAETQTPTSTLRQTFSRRLLLLLALFSVVMSLVIVLIYQDQTNELNRNELDTELSHLKARMKDHRGVWTENASQLSDSIEWAGLLDLGEPQRSNNLRAFFTARARSLGFEGIAITDKSSGKLLFDYWNNTERPDMQSALKADQPLWFDAQHVVLYMNMHKSHDALGHHFKLTFFKAWDSAMLHMLSFPGTTSYISLGGRPLVSSAGNLSLETEPPTTSGYIQKKLDGMMYQEASSALADVETGNGQHLPLTLTVRAPLKNILPIPVVLAASIGITLLFGVLLFIVIGSWLRRLGSRLDSLAQAATHFRNQHPSEVTEETHSLVQAADGSRNDQISMMARELSDLMISAAERDTEQRAYLQTLDLLQDAVIEFTPDGHLLHATDAWKALTGVDDLADCGLVNCVHPEDAAQLLEQISSLTHQQKQQVHIRFRMVRQNDPGKHYWVEGRFAAVWLHDTLQSIRGVVRDITTTYHQERQISHMALHDALTDLPNRVLLDDRLEMSISRAARTGKRVALGFIDLDHFKQVNDNFGHKLGDRLLKEVTLRLQTALRSTDTLSRWGGDEFVVLCPDLDNLEDALEITRKLSRLTHEHVTIDGTDFPFTFSAGFAVYPDDAHTSETLLAQADRAMFFAKAQGRNNIQFFNTIAAKESGRQSFYIQSRLMQAINSNRIQCWLQPIMSAQTGEVIGAEALARWHEPEQGWIPPSVFIPMAESMGLIDRVGQAVWQQALDVLALLPQKHQLSVNLSKRQLFTSTIVQQLCDDIERSSIDPTRIMLEITESLALSDVAYAQERIHELDSIGFGISIDDFGVGYSSLSQLHEIPADELKLDIAFVSRIHQKTGLSLATAIVGIAKSLNLECVAEGVEDAKTAALLSALGVERLQGYHFARPMPIEDYMAWLSARPPVYLH